MKREEKQQIIEELSTLIEGTPYMYLTDISELDAGNTSDLRRECHKQGIKLVVVKNTLLKKALDKFEGKYDDLDKVLVGSTSLMLSDQANVPAKLIKEFRKKNNKPIVKAAYVYESFYFGDEQLAALTELKSKNELIADIVLLLQSPVNNVMSSLKSGGNILTGVLETLSKKE